MELLIVLLLILIFCSGAIFITWTAIKIALIVLAVIILLSYLRGNRFF